MTHTYAISGMTCSSCEAKVKSALILIENVIDVSVSKEEKKVIIQMDKHIPITQFQEALSKKDPRYSISAMEHHETVEVAKNWLKTYKPLLLIFVFISSIALITSHEHGTWDYMKSMRFFMAGFFIVFSFFKFLDLKGFAESYSMYDIIAKKIPAWGFVYASIELALGLAYLTDFEPLITNILTFIVMTVSILGVISSVLKKQAIQCACLGAVFNLPMSTVTIIEDAIMIAMSAGMIAHILWV